MDAEWPGTPEQLAKDLACEDLKVLVAEQDGGVVVGFVAWVPAYDFHHCVRGGTIEDLFVLPRCRVAGLGVELILAAAAGIQAQGGAFLRGLSVAAAAVEKLYGRVAVCRGTEECTVSGRAFRQLAKMKGESIREIVGHLPDPAWNFEA